MSVILQAQGVSKRFGGVAALTGVDLEVSAGEIRGLIGPNGSGKTTLLNVLSGAIRPDAGAIRFRGQAIQGAQPAAIARAGLARTFQNLKLFEKMSVLENVLVGRHMHLRAGLWATALRLGPFVREEAAARQRALELLDFVGLAGRAGDTARDLSYGERRLLEIARALACEPQLLLLDEPVAGMNDSEKEHAIRLIQRIRSSGVAVLLVEHSMRVIMTVCDRITVLNYGRRLAEGRPDQIQGNPEVVEAYLGREAG